MIKNDLVKLYDALSKIIAILYKKDENLKITTYEGNYLEDVKYKLLIQGYKDIIKIIIFLNLFITYFELLFSYF